MSQREISRVSQSKGLMKMISIEWKHSLIWGFNFVESIL